MRTLAVVFLALAILPSCGATGSQEAPQAPRRPTLPWTRAFSRSALIVADEIHVEGPEELLEHYAGAQDPDRFLYMTKTTEIGLVQETRLRPDDPGGVEIRAQIDAWELFALKRIVVVQRPGEVPVTIRARGNAWWRTAEGGEEQRADELVFRGVRGE